MSNYSVADRLKKEAPFGDLEQTIATLGSAWHANPEDAAVTGNLAVALRCQGQLETAIALYRRAINIDPDSVAVLSNYGGALRAAGELDEAIRILRKTVMLAPDFASAHLNLGLALEDAGDLPAALHEYDIAQKLEPSAKALGQRAFTLLRMGNLREGWRAYEGRFNFEPMLRRKFSQPRWNGDPFRGKTILLYAEQGMGDVFQFIRYASIVKELGGRVIVECGPGPAPLVAVAAGVDKVVTIGEELPHFDYQASLMSLPFIMNTELDSIPSSMPYLSPPRSVAGRVKLRNCAQFKVGIVWTAGHEDFGAHKRSVSFAHFLKLLELPKVKLYSLQVGPARSDLQSFGCAELIQDVGAKLKDFAHTAEAISQLDLIISVDTAVLHVAAAMAKPTWVLLPFAAEWRWLQHREDSPWYPTAKLYRQSSPCSWENVFERLKHDLEIVAK